MTAIQQELLPAEVKARPAAIQVLDEMAALETRARTIVKVTSAADYTSAVEVLRLIAATIKKQEEERLKITRPMDEAKKNIMDLFARQTNPLQVVDKVIRKQLSDFDAEQTRLANLKRQEVEAKAKQEREEAARKAREAEADAQRKAAAAKAAADQIAAEQRAVAAREAAERRQAAEAARLQEEAARLQAEEATRASEAAKAAEEAARAQEEEARKAGDAAAAAAAAAAAQTAADEAEREKRAAQQAADAAKAASQAATQEEKAAETVVRKADQSAQAVLDKAEQKAETIVQRGTARAEQLQAHAQSIVAPVVTEERPRVTGSARVKKWMWKVKEGGQVDRKFLKLDESKIGSTVRALGKDAEEVVGGIEVWDENTHRITAAK